MVGRLIDAAVIQLGDAQLGEGLGPGVGEVIAARHFVQHGRVGAGLGQEDLRWPAVLHPVGGQTQGRQRGQQPFRLGPAAGVLDGHFAGRVFHLLFEEEIRLQVEDGLQDLGDRHPVAVAALGGLDVLRGGLLNLTGHLGVLGEHLGHGRPADGRRRHRGRRGQRPAEHSLTWRDFGQDEERQDGEPEADDARFGGWNLSSADILRESQSMLTDVCQTERLTGKCILCPPPVPDATFFQSGEGAAGRVGCIAVPGWTRAGRGL